MSARKTAADRLADIEEKCSKLPPEKAELARARFVISRYKAVIGGDIPHFDMTLETANEILERWRQGVEQKKAEAEERKAIRAAKAAAGGGKRKRED